MILFENIGIGVDEEFGYFRAYAYNSVTLDNVEYYKAENKEDAVAGLFELLKATAIGKVNA